MIKGEMNEMLTEQAFSRQAGVFDATYQGNAMIRYKRERVRRHLQQFIKPGSSILELNSGTGEDAAYFAHNGHHVHATDISEEMLLQLRTKISRMHLEEQVSTELRSFTDLKNLDNKGPYDHLFSNFGGLNCTGDLAGVLSAFTGLLKNGGIATMVIIPKFCLWEALLLFKGKFRTASRRWLSKNGRIAHIEGTYFKCWYYNASFVMNHLKKDFDVLAIEGLCCFVPPSYIEGFIEKYPKIYSLLKKAEERLKCAWPWKYWGDYYIISLRKK